MSIMHQFISIATILVMITCIITTAVSAVPAPAPVPSTMVALPDVAYCTSSAFHSVTSTLDKQERFNVYTRKGTLGEESCKILSSHYGPQSDKPTSNCFCHQQYWEELKELQDLTYIDVSSLLAGCNEFNSTSTTIYYYGEEPCKGPEEEEEGDGPLDPQVGGEAIGAALAPAAEDVSSPASSPSSDDSAILPMRTFSQWVGGLKNDGWGAVAFAGAIIGLFGFLTMVWLMLFDAVMSIKQKFE